MKHEFGLTVRSTDVDMIGHVNHAQYLVYMEWARFEWLRDAGLTLEELTKRNLLPVVVRVEIDYKKELIMDEKVNVVSEALRLGNKSAVIGQRVMDAEGNTACEAEVTVVMIDATSRRATSLPEEFREAFATE